MNLKVEINDKLGGVLLPTKQTCSLEGRANELRKTLQAHIDEVEELDVALNKVVGDPFAFFSPAGICLLTQRLFSPLRKLSKYIRKLAKFVFWKSTIGCGLPVVGLTAAFLTIPYAHFSGLGKGNDYLLTRFLISAFLFLVFLLWGFERFNCCLEKDNQEIALSRRAKGELALLLNALKEALCIIEVLSDDLLSKKIIKLKLKYAPLEIQKPFALTMRMELPMQDATSISFSWGAVGKWGYHSGDEAPGEVSQWMASYQKCWVKQFARVTVFIGAKKCVYTVGEWTLKAPRIRRPAKGQITAKATSLLWGACSKERKMALTATGTVRLSRLLTTGATSQSLLQVASYLYGNLKRKRPPGCPAKKKSTKKGARHVG